MKTFHSILIGFAIGTVIIAAIFASYVHFSETRTVTSVSATPQPEITLPPVQIPSHAALPGEWYWNGVPYFIFDEGGTGARNNGVAWQEFDWWIRGDVLFMCHSPENCLGDCNTPNKWLFDIKEDELTLTHTVNEKWVFVYTRS